MYYIEGTIDAIDVFGTCIRFSLLPSNAHLLSIDEGEKKALFVSCALNDAKLIEPKKNATGKGIVWFSVDANLLNVLLSAKNNRCSIRVCCASTETIELLASEPTPVCAAIKAEGIRVF